MWIRVGSGYLGLSRLARSADRGEGVAKRQRTDRSGAKGRTGDGPEPVGAVLDLGDTEPLVDLRDVPSICFSGQSRLEAAVPLEQPGVAADTGSVERRDAIQRSRLSPWCSSPR